LTTTLRFKHLSVRSFRNLVRVDFAPAPRLNVIAGNNGQGKTSLLEALYVTATTRSFRSERVREVVRDGDEFATTIARVCNAEGEYEQRSIIGRSTKNYLLDGKKAERLSRFAIQTPVVVFHPGDLALVSGSAALRRTLLDRIALHASPASGDHRARYTRALRERQRVLQDRGSRAPELEVFEQLMATHGSHFARSRREASERLIAALVPAFESMAASDLRLVATYRAGGTEESEAFRERLRSNRNQDAQRRSATFGPQRDDLDLELNDRSARKHASQGQQRILTLALKIAELDCVRLARASHPVLLLDDVSSELDPTRTGAVYEFLRRTDSQVFVTTTRPELFSTPGIAKGERADWRLDSGGLRD
jgi:DNA replication and repair protein RecF